MLGHNGKLVAMTEREQAHRDRLTTEAARALLGLVSHAGTRANAPDAVTEQEVKRHAAAVGRTLRAIAECAAGDAVRGARRRGADSIDAEIEATVHAMRLIDAVVGQTFPDAVRMAQECGAGVRQDLEAVN